MLVLVIDSADTANIQKFFEKIPKYSHVIAHKNGKHFFLKHSHSFSFETFILILAGFTFEKMIEFLNL